MHSWSEAAISTVVETKSLHVSQFAPLADKPRLTAGGVWGTRGPKFKSRRPDEGKPRTSAVLRFFVLWVGDADTRVADHGHVCAECAQALDRDA